MPELITEQELGSIFNNPDELKSIMGIPSYSRLRAQDPMFLEKMTNSMTISRRHGIDANQVYSNYEGISKKLGYSGDVSQDFLRFKSEFNAENEKPKINQETVGTVQGEINSFIRGVYRSGQSIDAVGILMDQSSIAELQKMSETGAPTSTGELLSGIRFSKQQISGFQEQIQEREKSIQNKLKGISKKEAEILAIPVSEAFRDWQKAQGSNAVSAFLSNPVEVATNIALEGLGSSAPTIIGTVAGGAVGGPKGAAGGAAIGAFAQEFSASIIDSLQREGVDVQDEVALSAAFNDSELMDRVLSRATKRGSVIGVTSAIGGMIAGKFVPKGRGAAAFTIGGLKDLGVQSGVEGFGEALAQMAADGEIDLKEVFAETIGGVPAASTRTAVGALTRISSENLRSNTTSRSGNTFTKEEFDSISSHNGENALDSGLDPLQKSIVQSALRGSESAQQVIRTANEFQDQAEVLGALRPIERPSSVKRGPSNKLFNASLMGQIANQPEPVRDNQQQTELDNATADDFAEKGTVKQFVDNIIQPISSQIRDISPRVFGRLQEYEKDLSTAIGKRNDLVEPFLEHFHKILRRKSKADFNSVWINLMNQDFDSALQTMQEFDERHNTNLSAEFGQVRMVLDELFQEASESGVDIVFRENYYPRNVKDYNGLSRHFGKKRGLFRKALFDAEEKLGRRLEPHEQDELFNRVMAGQKIPGIAKGGLRNFKGRQIQKVTEDMLQYYEQPEKTLLNYIRSVSTLIEKKKLFGRDQKISLSKEPAPFLNKFDSELVQGPEGSVQGSLGSLIRKFLEDQNIPEEIQADLISLIKARFEYGDAPMSKGLAMFRDFVYGILLGNPFSAITQIEDLSVVAYKNGIKNTALGTVKRDITVDDLGLRKHINTDVGIANGASKALDFFLEKSGFTAIDRLGKNSFLNARLDMLRTLVEDLDSPKSQKFFSDFKSIHGQKMTDDLISELQNRQIGYATEQAIWDGLAEIQPISRLEMPPAYLRNPNRRIFYMLKSFLIKRIDLTRQEAFKEMAEGRVGNGLKNFALLMFLLSLGRISAESLKDIILGREIKISDYAFDSLLSMVGLNRYMGVSLSKDGLGSAVRDAVIPPVRPFDHMSRDVYGFVVDEDQRQFTDFESVQYIPFAGRFLKWRLQENMKEAEKKKKSRRSSFKKKRPSSGDRKSKFRKER